VGKEKVDGVLADHRSPSALCVGTPSQIVEKREVISALQ